MLAGRDRDLENFQSLTERLAIGGYERSLIYTGLRGVGKTVLLMELDVLASEAGWATTDVQEVGSQPDFRVTFARMAARLLREMSRRHRVKQRVERALGVVKAFMAVPASIQLKLDVEVATGIADSGDPEQDLTDLLCEIGGVARATGAGALHGANYSAGYGSCGASSSRSSAATRARHRATSTHAESPATCSKPGRSLHAYLTDLLDAHARGDPTPLLA